MTKVKRRGVKAPGSGAGPKRAKAGARAKSARTGKSKGRRAGGKAARGRKALEPPAPRVVKVRALDPREKCGKGTSVERLFRVDETSNGSSATHLVFFDRHGLYCEHGRACPAVDDVRKANRNLDWTR